MNNSSSGKSIHSGHRQRVKKNVLQNGFTQLEEHKLLELLLFYSIPRDDTNELAHRLLVRFGSLSGVFKASAKELLRVDGVGENTAVMIAAMGEAYARSAKESVVKKRSYKTDDDFKELAASFFINQTVEKVVVFCFDSSKKLKNTVLIAEGNASFALLNVRKVIEAVIENSASVAVLAHNHPEGGFSSSVADVDATRSTAVMLRKIGVMLADHIIVGDDGKAYSMHSDERFNQIFY